MTKKIKSELDKIKVYTEQEIREKSIDLSELWLVQFQGELRGPFYQIDLLKYSMTAPKFYSSLLTCNLRTKKWKPLFEHEIFNKRDDDRQVGNHQKPHEKKAKEFLYLFNGQKRGPFSEKEINDKLHLGELSLDSLLSSDNGKSWKKFYQFEQFDRRGEEDDEGSRIDIIKAPKNEEFEKSRIYTRALLEKLKKEPGAEADIKNTLLAVQKISQRKKAVSLSEATAIEAFDPDSLQANSKRTKIIRTSLVACLAILVLSIVFEQDKTSNKTGSKSFSPTESSTHRERANSERFPADQDSTASRNREEALLNNNELEVEAGPSKRRPATRVKEAQEDAVEETPEEDYSPDNDETVSETSEDDSDFIDESEMENSSKTRKPAFTKEPAQEEEVFEDF